MLVEHGADGDADLGRTAQRTALAPQPGGDSGEPALGRLQQVLALAAAPDGEVGIAADDKAFARVEPRRGSTIGRDLGHVALIEQGGLEWSARGGEIANAGRAQRGDPVEAGRFDVGFKPRVGDHAVPGLDPGIADQHDAA